MREKRHPGHLVRQGRKEAQMIRSPIFEIKKTGWWRQPEGWLQFPINAAAFFLALLLVTAVTSLAGSVLGEALSAPKAGLLLPRKADGRSGWSRSQQGDSVMASTTNALRN
jgi:hypothetical protein